MMNNVQMRQVIALFVLPIIGFAGLALYSFELNKTFLTAAYLFTLVLTTCLILSRLDNLLIASRLSLLYIVGAYPMGVKLINEDYFFSVFEFTTQSLDITTTMYALTLVALPGCYLGWDIGQRIKLATTAQKSEHVAVYSEAYYTALFYICAFFAIFCGYLIAGSSSGTILESAYGTGTEGSPPIGTAGALGGVAVSVMFYCALKLRNKVIFLLTFLVSAYLFVWCQILRGLRQDVVGALLSLFVIFLIANHKEASLKVKYVLYLAPFVALLELWGLMRTGLHSWLADEIDFSTMIDMGLGNAASVDGTIYSGTLGPITTTFANTVYLVKERFTEIIYGQGYFDYILRIPPEFLYPDRPQDYATMFVDYGLSSGGGFFELAEAYLNFGILGAIFIPFIISTVISFVYHQAKKEAHVFYIFALSSFLCVWLRGGWYQTFAFYKSFISACALFFVAHTFTILLANGRSIIAGAQREKTVSHPAT